MIDDLKLYKVGLYLRLSKEDEEKTEISESINNQKDFLTMYAIKQGWRIIDTYIDDGYSGTNFNRPSFLKMVEDIKKGIINLVITKDLSRLGRNYSQIGYYIDEFFPLYNVRYIAINDSIDTQNNDEMVGYKALISDTYSRDISKKVRTAFFTRQLKGIYMGTSAPFGYKKDSENHGHLVIDDYSSNIVKQIFEEYLNGKPLTKIANKLIMEEVPTPSEYSKIKNTQKIAGAWNITTLRRILKNEVYIGHTIQHKKQCINYKVRKQRAVNKSDWIKVENTHQPIIDSKLFDNVQEILKKRSYYPAKRKYTSFNRFNILC